MFKRFLAGLLSIAASVLPGCDAISMNEFKPGISTAAEVRQKMGAPSAEYANADGSVTWEYNRQPQGVHTHMLTFGPDKVLLRIEQVLSEAYFAQVSIGLDKAQVTRLLGKPARTTVFSMKNEEVWDWRIEETNPQGEWYFHVHFDVNSGQVVRTSKLMVPGP
ncbi:MAG: hypothetical protein H6943_00105 [Zoogloeaceae bacterium]|nr:hypothetical protein [Zoogloeaceae bacterium]